MASWIYKGQKHNVMQWRDVIRPDTITVPTQTATPVVIPRVIPKMSTTVADLFRRVASQYIQANYFLHRLLAAVFYHAEVLRNDILDALQDPTFDNWLAGVQRQYTSLGMATPFSGGSKVGVNSFLMHLDVSEPCLPVRRQSGRSCTSPHAQRHPERQSSAHTSFRGLDGVL